MERVERNDHEMSRNKKRYEVGSSCIQNDVERFEFPIGDFPGSLESRPILDQWNGEENGAVAFHGQRRSVEEWRRSQIPSYPVGEPSNYQHGSFHGYAEQKRIHHGFVDGPSRVENLEHDRAELIRKLDELRDQISRSWDLTPREIVPPPPPGLPNRYFGHDSYVQESSTRLYSVNMQSIVPDKYASEPLYSNPNHQPARYTNSPGVDVQDLSYPQSKIANGLAGYDSSDLHQWLRKPPNRPPPPPLMKPYHDHFSGECMDFNERKLASRQHETFSHQFACSCLQCYTKIRKFPPQVAQFYGSRDSYPPHLHSLTREPQTRSSVDSASDIGGVAHHNPMGVVVDHGNEKVCHPISGGAPFLTCSSCFELLKLPRKFVVVGKNQQKVRCGACSAITLIEFEEKKFIVSVPKAPKQVSAEGDDGSGETLRENLESNHDHSNTGVMVSSSDDSKNSSFRCPLTDTEVGEPYGSPSDKRLNFGESIETREPLSSTSSVPVNEGSPDSVISQRGSSISSIVPPIDAAPSPFSDFLDQNEPASVDSSNNVVTRCEDQEKVILKKSTSRQNSVEVVSVATEMEVPFDESPYSGVSQDSAEVRKEEDCPCINKGSEPYSQRLSNASTDYYSVSSQSVEEEIPNVFVNGHPIPYCVVKKAENLAGSIKPGNYWYDYLGGFWGVMGQSCLGIIPPFIEEFKYPMPENCAAGNTGVFVNGRELSQKDLDLLSGRGLPTTRDRYYVVEIGGRVLDENTGEELDSLGQLAPTVKKAKHGFGLKTPRSLGQ